MISKFLKKTIDAFLANDLDRKNVEEQIHEDATK
jgi:hypothetical protein